MLHILSLELELAKLKQLADQAVDDDFMLKQFKSKIKSIQEKLNAAKGEAGTLFQRDEHHPAKSCIFFYGEDEHDLSGVDAQLAGRMLTHYAEMYSAQARQEEKEAVQQAGKKTRPRGTPRPRLLLTDTPRGSFGLELTANDAPPSSLEPSSVLTSGLLAEIHESAMNRVIGTITNVATTPGHGLPMLLETMPSAVLKPLRGFFRDAAKHDVSIRLSIPNRHDQIIEHMLSAEQIKLAAAQLENALEVETEDLLGVFRGVTHESGIFDLVVGEALINGHVSDDFDEAALAELDNLLNKECKAQVIKTKTMSVVGLPSKPRYTLVKAMLVKQEEPIDS